jgi:hypothetical protein
VKSGPGKAPRIVEISVKTKQGAEAELKPAAFALRRVGFGRLSLHCRIIRDRGQSEQGSRDGTPEHRSAQRLSGVGKRAAFSVASR